MTSSFLSRFFRKTLATILVGFFIIGVIQVSEAANPKTKPNVLFISIDDLNDWIGVMGGHPQANTPNIDRLINRGVLFNNCYCAAPACNPSRVALMTGLRPSSTGVYINPIPWRSVLKDAVTLPQHFMANGYYALGSGKIYHGSYGDTKSWNEYAPSALKQTFPSPPKGVLNKNGLNKTHFDWAPIPAKKEEMGDYKTVDYVVKQLNKKWDQPFFLACGIFRPHLPWYVPEEYFEKYPLDKIVLPKVLEDDLKDIPKLGLKMAKPEGDHAAVIKNGQWKKAVQGYLASIAFADDMIGRVVDAFDKSDHRDNTVIVFWTDHGWHLGEKNHWRKFSLWEEATRTPMAIILPDSKTSGVKCTKPVNLVDIYPTLNELCGLPKRDELEGQSLVPLVENPKADWEVPSITTHGRNNHSIRSEHWRYIRYTDGSEELYDHKKDPMEWKNLATLSEYDSIKQNLAKWLPKVNVRMAPTESNIRASKQNKKGKKNRKKVKP